MSYSFKDADYDFFNDKKEIIATLPDKLTKKSIHKFIHYSLYELQVISAIQTITVWITPGNSWKIFITITCL